MAQQHKLNGTNVDLIGRAIWRETVVAQALNGEPVVAAWRKHIWRTNILTAAQFDTLYAQEGAIVTLTTTDYTNPNSTNYVQYFGALFQKITAQHAGPAVGNVILEFLIKVIV